MKHCFVLASLCIFVVRSDSQIATTSSGSGAGAQPQLPAASSTGRDAVTPPSDYVLGAGDQLVLVVPDLATDFDEKTFRIDMSGTVSLPYVGHLQAAGLTTSDLEFQVKQHLQAILKDPQVVINITAFGGQPASVLGSVNTPGIVQLQGRKNIFQVLALAGGFADDAGYSVNLTREIRWGAIPVPGAHLDVTGQHSIASIKIKDIMNSTDAAENIEVLPGDIVSVPKADLVYAVGSVMKPGGFLLNQHDSLSALQVVSLAEGLQRTAAADKAKVLRKLPGSLSRVEIAVNLKQIMAGAATDVPLLPDDILFIPSSAVKVAGLRSIEAIVTATTGMAVYGRF